MLVFLQKGYECSTTGARSSFAGRLGTFVVKALSGTARDRARTFDSAHHVVLGSVKCLPTMLTSTRDKCSTLEGRNQFDRNE